MRTNSTFIVYLRASAVLMMCAIAAGMAQVSGRPPVGPLERYEPRVYDFNFGATLRPPYARQVINPERFDLVETPIIMPIIYLGTYNRVAPDSLRAWLWLENRQANPNLQLKSDYPHNTTLATLTVPRFTGREIRWQIGYRVQVWSSRIDDAWAAQIPWPEEWPLEVMDGLEPQAYIESDDPIFAQAVEHVTKGRLREMPPYIAAKELIRYCINEIQTTGDGLDRAEFNVLRGMWVNGALHAAQNQLGSPHDLLCVCIATLRAAGIPARPVIGSEENRRNQTVFVSWGEFYLPQAGWVPFDPYVMRGKGIRTMNANQPWPEFGTMDDLNRRIPLAFHFMPPVTVQSPSSPGVWGWDPRIGESDVGGYQIQMNITSRGRGVEDP